MNHSENVTNALPPLIVVGKEEAVGEKKKEAPPEITTADRVKGIVLLTFIGALALSMLTDRDDKKPGRKADAPLLSSHAARRLSAIDQQLIAIADNRNDLKLLFRLGHLHAMQSELETLLEAVPADSREHKRLQDLLHRVKEAQVILIAKE